MLIKLKNNRTKIVAVAFDDGSYYDFRLNFMTSEFHDTNPMNQTMKPFVIKGTIYLRCYVRSTEWCSVYSVCYSSK